MDVQTVAYVAGIIDTQAVIRTRKAVDTDLPSIAVHGPNTAMLKYLASITGTRSIVTRRSYSRAGCNEHCKEKHQHVVSVSGRWSVTGVKATVLLWNIRPYVRLQVDAVTSALNVGMEAPFKPGVLQKMVDLGWEIPDI